MEAVEVTATEEETENKAGTLAQMQEIVLKVQVCPNSRLCLSLLLQEGLGFVASNLESVSNIFNFTFPFLSFLGLVITILVTLLLCILPMR